MKISTVAAEDAPQRLLRLGDPSPERIGGYMRDSVIFLGVEEGLPMAIAVIQRRREEIELMNLAISEERQGKGRGKQMVAHVLRHALKVGAARVTVGTGNSSLFQLAFYQKCGFRITGVRKSFFREYEPPIFENGIRCLDMVRLTFEMSEYARNAVESSVT